MATNLTGNPNGLSRALLKMQIGISQAQQREGQTNPLLSCFRLLPPAGSEQALTIGSIYPRLRFEHLLQWDLSNPHRHWLVLNNSHAAIGDRLQKLDFYARQWQLDTELDLSDRGRSSTHNLGKLLWQGAPFFGWGGGLAIACSFWLLAWLAVQGQMFEWRWVLVDFDYIRDGLMLIGFALGTLLRFNSFFPEINQRSARELNLLELIKDPTSLPIDGKPGVFKGVLRGRAGIANWWGQDLFLQTPDSAIKLHYCSQLGAIGNLWQGAPRPWPFIRRGGEGGIRSR